MLYFIDDPKISPLWIIAAFHLHCILNTMAEAENGSFYVKIWCGLIMCKFLSMID